MEKQPDGKTMKGKDEWGWKETADRYQTSKMHREEWMRWRDLRELYRKVENKGQHMQ